MMPRILPFLAMVASVIMGVIALLSGELLMQLLGGLAIIVAAGMGISQIQVQRALMKPPPLGEKREPGDPLHSTLGDRLFAIFFLGGTIILVIVLALYTAWQLGLY